jgi:hypothetical protein
VSFGREVIEGLEDRKRTTAALHQASGCQTTIIKLNTFSPEICHTVNSFDESIKPIVNRFQQVTHLRPPTEVVFDCTDNYHTARPTPFRMMRGDYLEVQAVEVIVFP